MLHDNKPALSLDLPGLVPVLDPARKDDLYKLSKVLQSYPQYGRALAYIEEIQKLRAVSAPATLHFLRQPLLLSKPNLNLPPAVPTDPPDWHRMKVTHRRISTIARRA
jgi:hypothetical protein